MEHVNPSAATIETLQKAMGEAFAGYVSKKNDIKTFAKDSGVPRSTLYRFFNGETVGTDVFLRILRALDRYDLLEELISPIAETPLERIEKKRKSDALSRDDRYLKPDLEKLKLAKRSKKE